MAGTAVISLEHVLAKPSEGIPIGVPIPTGTLLYHALKTQFKLAVVSSAKYDEARHWLDGQGLTDHPYLLGRSDDELGRTGQIDELRRLIGNVELVIDGDPEVVRDLMISGVNALLFVHPLYSVPHFRPDTHIGARSWEEIEAEIDRERKRKKHDPRADADTGKFVD